MASGDITINGRILFTEGLMVNSIQCQVVSVTQDNLLEASENFNIFVSDIRTNVDGTDILITDNVLLPTDNATLTIQDVLQEGGGTFLEFKCQAMYYFFFLILTADITAAFNFTTLEGAEGTTVIVCAEITSLLILNTSVTFQVGVSEPSDLGKSITLHVNNTINDLIFDNEKCI